MQCARHPKVETNLACGRCEKAICPSCAISGPVGMRCRDCASLRSSTLYQVRPERFALATILGLAAGTVVGVCLDYAATYGFILYLVLFVGPIVGGFLGDVIRRAAGNKRGLPLEILAGVSVIGGAIIAQLFFGDWRFLFASPVHLIVYGVAVILTACAAVARMRSV